MNESSLAKPFDLPGSEFVAARSELKVASQGALKRALCKKLAQIKECSLSISEGPETISFGDAAGDDVLRADAREGVVRTVAREPRCACLRQR